MADAVCSFANIVDNFHPGKDFNVADTVGYSMDEVVEIVQALEILSHSLTERLGDPFTTRTKHVDISTAARDLRHTPKRLLPAGIARTVE